MISCCTLEIAGIRIALTSAPDLPIQIEGSARKFVAAADDGDYDDYDHGAAADKADVHIHTRWGRPRAPDSVPAFDSGKGLWRLYRTPEGSRFVFTSPSWGPQPYQAARFSDDYTRGEVTLRRDVFGEKLPVYPLHYPLDEVFMVHLLSRGLGVEIHGSGVVTADGRGLLFAGQSGAGKTTLSKIWLGEPGVRILSDERIIVRREGGEMFMYGTPWHGDGHIANPGRVKLERVFFLHHGAENALATLPRTLAVARLFCVGFTPFHDAAGLDFSLRLLTELATTCRCEELRFVPDRRVVDFVLTH